MVILVAVTLEGKVGIMPKTEQTHDESVGTPRTPREHITVTSAQVAAAKLQISIDRKFGRKTPKIIKLIAAAK